jgi:hypothetical protein
MNATAQSQVAPCATGECRRPAGQRAGAGAGAGWDLVDAKTNTGADVGASSDGAVGGRAVGRLHTEITGMTNEHKDSMNRTPLDGLEPLLTAPRRNERPPDASRDKEHEAIVRAQTPKGTTHDAVVHVASNGNQLMRNMDTGAFMFAAKVQLLP